MRLVQRAHLRNRRVAWLIAALACSGCGDDSSPVTPGGGAAGDASVAGSGGEGGTPATGGAAGASTGGGGGSPATGGTGGIVSGGVGGLTSGGAGGSPDAAGADVGVDAGPAPCIPACEGSTPYCDDGTCVECLAFAAGIPSSQPLVYSGTLMSLGGTALTGTRGIDVVFWDDAAAGNALCSTGVQNVALQLGRFSVSLPDSCTDVVRANTDIWVEVIVDSESLGRAKAGAVPYAVSVDTSNLGLSSLVTMIQDMADERLGPTSSGGSPIVTGAAAGAWASMLYRTLPFTKRYPNSRLKVTYQDSLGSLATSYAACEWRLLLDGNQILFFSDADLEGKAATSWMMANAAHIAWATASAGAHTLVVQWRGNAGAWTSTTQCLAGWNTAGNFLSVEEIP